MLINELLLEMPMLTRGPMSTTMLDTSMDTELLKNNYHKFGKINNIDLYINLRVSDVVGIDNGTLALKLELDNKITNPALTWINDVVQVRKIAIRQEYAGQGIASSLYELLVDNGFTIVSDDSQYDPGKALWKRLAKTNSVYLLTLSGKFKPYNGNNIPDDEIWSTDKYGHGYGSVLVMTNQHL